MANDRLFVIGGQEGDFMAKPGSPIFKCSRRHEVYLVVSSRVYCELYLKACHVHIMWSVCVGQILHHPEALTQSDIHHIYFKCSLFVQ